MNYTKNYHLPQWVKEDRIMMDDFNRMCADMEAGLTKNAQDLKTGLNKTAQDAAAATSSAAATAAAASSAAMTAAQEAQSTADAALAKANAAFAVDNRPYVWGKYIGTGKELEITLGFQPYFLMIWMVASDNTSSTVLYLSITQGASNDRMVTATKTGFKLSQNSSNAGINMSGAINHYLAFR